MAEDSAELVNKPFKFWVDCYGVADADSASTGYRNRSFALAMRARKILLGVFLAATGADVDAVARRIAGGPRPMPAWWARRFDFVMMRDETALEGRRRIGPAARASDHGTCCVDG